MKVTNPDEFLLGQRDCEKGIKHKHGRHEDYDRGYSAQYEIEQVIDYRTRSHEDCGHVK